MMAITRGLRPLETLLALVAVAVATLALAACDKIPDPDCGGEGSPPLLDAGGGSCELPPPDCEGCASIWGDPHLVTFDGLTYNLMAVGEFTAVRTDQLEVQIRTEPYGDSRLVSLLTAVAIDTGAGVVSVTFEGEAFPPATVVRVDGQPVDLGERNTKVGDVVLGRGPAGEVMLAWPDGTLAWVDAIGGLRMELFVDLPDGAQPIGVMGDRDGDTANDLATADGTPLPPQPSYDELYGEFANSWRVSDVTSLFPYSEGESTATYTDLTFPDTVVTLADLDTDAAASARAVCESAGVTTPGLLDACIIDVALTGDENYAASAAAVEARTLASDSAGDVAATAGPAATWVAVAEGISASAGYLPVVVGDAVVAVGADQHGSGALVAFDKASGDERWRLSGVVGRCGAVPLGDDAIVAVGSAGGPLATGDSATLLVIDAATGAVLRSAAWTERANFTYCLPGVAVDHTVVIPNALGVVVAWDVAGAPSVAWSLRDLPRIGTDIVAVSDGVAFTLEASDPPAHRELRVLDARTGEQTGVATLPGRREYGGTSVVAEGARVVVATSEVSDEPDVLGVLTGITVNAGVPTVDWQWQQKAGEPEGGVELSAGLAQLAIDGGVVVGHSSGRIVAVDAATGTPLWAYDPEGFRNNDSSSVIADGLVFNGVFGGVFVYSVRDGERVADLSNEQVASSVSAATSFGPVVGDALVISASVDGDLALVAIPIASLDS